MPRGIDSRTTQILVALIAAIGTVLVGYWQFGAFRTKKPDEDVFRFTGRVADSENEKRVKGAKVSLEAKGVPPVLYTDSEGVFSFELPVSVREIRIVIEASGYEPYERRVALGMTYGIEDIRLKRLHLPTGSSKKSSDAVISLGDRDRVQGSPIDPGSVESSESSSAGNQGDVNLPVRPSPLGAGPHRINLMIPTTMSDATVWLDGREARVLRRTATLITIEVPADSSNNHQIKVEREGGPTCVTTVAVTESVTTLTPCED
jgi:hypothetical protein